jgi:hypothetical protein
MVILFPLGTPSTYDDMGSSRPSLPSWASCRTIAAVIVLVTDAIRKYVSVPGLSCVPICVVPLAATNSPCGVRKRTTAPGTSNSFVVASTTVCSAAASIRLSPADSGAGLVDVDLHPVAARTRQKSATRCRRQAHIASSAAQFGLINAPPREALIPHLYKPAIHEVNGRAFTYCDPPLLDGMLPPCFHAPRHIAYS